MGKLVSPETSLRYDSRCIEKPRLTYYRGLMSYEVPDLDFIQSAFKTWSQYTEWLIFRGDNTHTGEKKFKAVKSAKRGNDVYLWHLKKRFEAIASLPDIKYFNYRDVNHAHKTKGLFVTLTLRREQRIDKSWETIGEKYNRYITKLRQRYGKINVIRVWESHKDGYPHIHALMFFEEKEFNTFYYEGTYRIQEKSEFEWEHGFVDVEALSGVKEGIKYITKYLTKLHEAGIDEGSSMEFANNSNLEGLQERASNLTLSLMWIFRRRAFSISGHILDLMRSMRNSKGDPRGKGPVEVDLEGLELWIWKLVGFWGGNLSENWAVPLSLADFRALKGSPSWSDHL